MRVKAVSVPTVCLKLKKQSPCDTKLQYPSKVVNTKQCNQLDVVVMTLNDKHITQ
jgi:hypothetical protein